MITYALECFHPHWLIQDDRNLLCLIYYQGAVEQLIGNRMNQRQDRCFVPFNMKWRNS